MDTNNLTIGATFAVYILTMLGIGFVAFRRTRNLTDYLLGGRHMGPAVSALSAGASDMSGWLLMGLPGFAYASGLVSFWTALGLLIGTYLNWKLVAVRLRRETERHGALTLPNYIERRFDDRRHMLRLVTALVTLGFFLLYTTSGLVASGKLFNQVFGIPYTTAVVLGALAILLYTSFGGFIAVCWTDAVQGMLMIGALLAVPLVTTIKAGGVGAVSAAVQNASPHMLDLFQSKSGGAYGPLKIASDMAWGLGYFGMPHILARFMAIESEAKIPRARRIATTWVATSLFMALAVGITGMVVLPEPLADSETVFISTVKLLFPPALAGVCLAGVLAAIMSTADSQLLVCTSVITEDFYRTLYRRDATEEELIWVGRISVVGIAAAAMLLAFDKDSKVMGIVAYAWAGFGAAFGPTILLSLYWKRMTHLAALAGILVGGATIVIWKNLQGGVFDLYELLPGFLASLAAIVIVTLLTPRGESQGEPMEYAGRA
jgi:sodium/proline symporter